VGTLLDRLGQTATYTVTGTTLNFSVTLLT
jgi:hypothetical protein